MNAVEIEEAVSDLAAAPFDAAEFPFAFLIAFDNKPVTVQRLRAGSGAASDVAGGVLQRNNIHMAVCRLGEVGATLAALRASPKTAGNKVKFVLATDGVTLEAEELGTGEALACDYAKFADHFAFFLPLAGISTVKQIKDNPVDIKATGRLNKLYVELLKDNPEWATAARRPDLNHFMARLIFCLFAEDTGIFLGEGLFSKTIEQMSDSQSTNTHEVMGELFRSMNTKIADRAAGNFRPWADAMPYVNGGLFSGSSECPRFSKIARSYLLRAAALDWQQINPDIFGSMIQAVADDEERGALGMHYTSVPNILKVLNPLFLDDLREQLEKAGENARALLNLRKRMAKIRVFDPACGSGNFLVIAYKQMRAIEAEINRRRREQELRTEIPLTNFRGIELRDFPAEIARLALIIAEYQCDVLYRGQKEALAEFLPLDAKSWITCGNALRLDWLSICRPAGTQVKLRGDDFFSTLLNQVEVDFENEGGETYICGNPPYVGSKRQTDDQKRDLTNIFSGLTKKYATLDYVTGWFVKAASFIDHAGGSFAFVTTNSIVQGEQVALLWPIILNGARHIHFAHRSFLWQNLASHNAGVTCVIVGVTGQVRKQPVLYDDGIAREVPSIGPYLVPSGEIFVQKRSAPVGQLCQMHFGNHPYYGASLIMEEADARALRTSHPATGQFMRPLFGTIEFVNRRPRACLWITDDDAVLAYKIPPVSTLIEGVRLARVSAKKDAAAQKLASTPYRFRDQKEAREHLLAIGRHSSENRPFLPVDLLGPRAVVSDAAFAAYDAPLWNLAIIASRIHLVWIETVCGKIKTDFRYSNTLGWNTFPVPPLTENNKADLTRCAEDILLAREAHWPQTIADLYDPDEMPDDLRRAHERNDETLERIYIGRTFRNDTERLEKLFELYTKMTAGGASKAKPVKAGSEPRSGALLT